MGISKTAFKSNHFHYGGAPRSPTYMRVVRTFISRFFIFFLYDFTYLLIRRVKVGFSFEKRTLSLPSSKLLEMPSLPHDFHSVFHSYINLIPLHYLVLLYTFSISYSITRSNLYSRTRSFLLNLTYFQISYCKQDYTHFTWFLAFWSIRRYFQQHFL